MLTIASIDLAKLMKQVSKFGKINVEKTVIAKAEPQLRLDYELGSLQAENTELTTENTELAELKKAHTLLAKSILQYHEQSKGVSDPYLKTLISELVSQEKELRANIRTSTKMARNDRGNSVEEKKLRWLATAHSVLQHYETGKRDI